MKYYMISIITMGFLLLYACSGPDGPQIEIQDPWVRAAGMEAAQDMDEGGESMAGHDQDRGNSAAYMVIKNTGNETDRLLSADTDTAQAAELHLSELVDDVMTMHQVTGIDVPARGEVYLEPGGFHVMLIGLKSELKAGDNVKLTLHFEKSGTVTVEARVRMP